MKIGLISDLHLREKMPYADLIQDGRESEVEEVLAHVTESFKECDVVVFMGDNLNSRINSAGTISRFVRFLESFGTKDVWIITGNHEKMSDSTSAIDFIGELKDKPNWELISGDVQTLTFENGPKVALMPYFHRTEVGATLTEDWQKAIDTKLEAIDADILLCHHSISGCGVSDYVSTDSFSEPVLNRETLEKKFKLVVGGHIHKATNDGKIHVLGNVFNSEIGEFGKRVAIIDTADFSFTPVPVPGRHVVKVNDPKLGDSAQVIADHGRNAIVKAEVTTERTPEEIAQLKKEFQVFDGLVFTERYFNKREKAHIESGVEELTVDNLVRSYAKAKGLDASSILRGLDLIA